MFKPKLLKQEQGFTLVEVLIAILVATIFVAVTMQMMAIATIFKVKAQEYAEATSWIQEELEYLKYQASTYQYTKLVDETTGDSIHESTDTVLHLDSVDDFQAGNTVIVGTDSTNKTIAASGVNTTAKTITLTTSLGKDQSTGTSVVVTTRCNPATKTEGFADGLRDKVTGSDQTTDSNDVDQTFTSKLFTSKQYTLRRTTTIYNATPYRVLQVKYQVSEGNSFNSSKVIASFDTEVIPNAALQCPN